MNVAKHYYQEFYRINPPMLGSSIDPKKLTKRQERRLRKLEETYLKLVCEEINACSTNHKENEIYVPSPWHAWVFLKILAGQLTSVQKNSFGECFMASCPVYRGQSHSDYPPIASFFRSDTDRNFEENCLKAFSYIFNQKFLWQVGIEMPTDSAIAAAQHYGIKTRLLDVTADPAVAIHFACRSKSRSFGDRSAVFSFDAMRFFSKEFKLVLPPPFVERLYLQRASFLSIPESGYKNLEKTIYKISFPFDSSFSVLDSEVSGKSCPDHEWFERLISWSKKWVREHGSFPEEPALDNSQLARIFDDIGHPKYSEQKFSADLISRWNQAFENLLYWYAIRIEGNSEYTRVDVAQEIVNANPSLIHFVNQLRECEILFLISVGADDELIQTKKTQQEFWVGALRR